MKYAVLCTSGAKKSWGYGPTNDIIKVVDGMKWRRLGGSDIVVSDWVALCVVLLKK